MFTPPPGHSPPSHVGVIIFGLVFVLVIVLVLLVVAVVVVVIVVVAAVAALAALAALCCCCSCCWCSCCCSCVVTRLTGNFYETRKNKINNKNKTKKELIQT